MNNDLFTAPEAARLMKDPQALKALLQSAEARQMMALLQQQGDLAAAAKAAQTGNTAGLISMLSRLQQSPEGAKALGDLKGKLEK